MGDVINLNRYRKARARAEKERLAAESRVRNGQSRAEKQVLRREDDHRAAELEGKLLTVHDDRDDRVDRVEDEKT
jgi:hypothetical protein